MVLAEVLKNWSGVEALRTRLQVSAFASVGFLGGTFPHVLAAAAHNLPFIHAFSVLDNVLNQLATEGHFTNGRFLGHRIDHAEKVLPWQDISFIRKGVRRRNEVTHHGQLVDRADCWAYIDAVKRELAAWNVL